MGRIVISSNATLDGVVQDPDGQEGFERGGWFHRYAGARDFEDWVANETEEALRAEALLLGRRSFEWFASREPVMGVRRTWADRPTRRSLSSICTISSECPPSSKKLSLRPTRSTRSNSCQIPDRISSISPRGASYARLP